MKKPQFPPRKIEKILLEEGIRHPDRVNLLQPGEGEDKPQFTGRYFVVMKDEKDGDIGKVLSVLKDRAGLRTIASKNDFDTEKYNEEKITSADALVYDDINSALVGVEENQMQRVQQLAAANGYIVIPERVTHVPFEKLTLDNNIQPTAGNNTWGLEATSVIGSSFTGDGIKVAVLDTGFFMNHPDFAGRTIIDHSLVPGETVDDTHGHGTHCIGTACGDKDVITGRRYGIAQKSIICAGKVFDKSGSTADAWILDGMDWASRTGCKVISMSLGAPVLPGMGFDTVFERKAKAVMNNGTIVVAAAGNESARSIGHFAPVGSPADCPSILAVGALNIGLVVADFSNRCINPTGQVDIAAPGVDVFSSWIQTLLHKTISGTSMATPHVAGILALLWEKFPGVLPGRIITEMFNLAQRLPLPAMDVGNGLLKAP